MGERESIHFDVLIIGAGPAGLSTAIRLKQLQPNLEVCVIEKSAQIGGHLVSGAVLEIGALNDLLPQWQQDAQKPLMEPVTQDLFYYFTEKGKTRLPTPPQMRNDGNYIISLSQFARYLATHAESLGVQIFPGFSADRPIIEKRQLKGVMTGDMGLNALGEPGENYQPGMALYAKTTVLAEGARGSLTKSLIQTFKLDQHAQPQTYAIGLKEVWDIPKKQHRPGAVWHSIGWPLDPKTYGGSFVYQYGAQKVSIGYVIGLDYENPYLNPYEIFQQFKLHPLCKHLLKKGQRIAYGARALTEGGWQSLPQLELPGGLIVGCAGGMVNPPKIKGIHNAMKSGMIAADLIAKYPNKKLKGYDQAIRNSAIGQELKRVRNIRPGFKYGLWGGLLNAAFETITFGYAPWTMRHHVDHLATKKADQFQPIKYPKHDGVYSFDLLTSVRLTATYHQENQPAHLVLKDPKKAIAYNYKVFASPETRYCPAGVYEVVIEKGKPRFQINAQNCIHCKTCDIKDMSQNIEWKTPQGGDGPNYSET